MIEIGKKTRWTRGKRDGVINAGDTESRVHRVGQQGAGRFPLDLFTRSFQQADLAIFCCFIELYTDSPERRSPCKHLCLASRREEGEKPSFRFQTRWDVAKSVTQKDRRRERRTAEMDRNVVFTQSQSLLMKSKFRVQTLYTPCRLYFARPFLKIPTRRRNISTSEK